MVTPLDGFRPLRGLEHDPVDPCRFDGEAVGSIEHLSRWRPSASIVPAATGSPRSSEAVSTEIKGHSDD